MAKKPIPGHPEYQIGSDGHVYNKVTGRKLREWKNSRGYMRTEIRNTKGATTRPLIHRLVAAAFVGGKSGNKNEVEHKDGNRKNNKSSNLKWISREGNEQAKHERNGSSKKSEKNEASEGGTIGGTNNNMPLKVLTGKKKKKDD